MKNAFSTLRRWSIRLAIVLALGSGTIGAWIKLSSTPRSAIPLIANEASTSAVVVVGGMVRIPAGKLPLGSHLAVSPAARPLPTLPIEAFWMDATEVTNRQYAEFVSATKYITTAEREGASDVFDTHMRRWQRMAGADWRHPTGENSSIAGRENFPVVQVSWADAAAYARWAGKRLPTEYEWEYAARGGLYDADYPWGRSETPNGAFRANAWQGWFPDTDRGVDGFTDLAPVKSYPANAYGLCDMAGNVWEWCADLYEPALAVSTERTNREQLSEPRPNEADELAVKGLSSRIAERDDLTTGQANKASAVERRIRRGGSWLCCENYSLGIKLSTRSSMPAGGRSNHVGFRCVSDDPTILPLDTARVETPAVK